MQGILRNFIQSYYLIPLLTISLFSPALRKAFASVDKTRSGFVDIKDIEGIFNNMGTAFDIDDLNATIKRVDIDSTEPFFDSVLEPIVSRYQK